MNEEEATHLIASVLQDLKTDEERLELAVRASEQKHKNENRSVDAIRQKLTLRLRGIKEDQDRLSRQKGTPQDVYERNMTSLQNEQLDMEMALAKLDEEAENNKVTFEEVKKVFLEANREADGFVFAKPPTQSKFVQTVLSKVTVKDKEAQQKWFKPAYQVIANLPKNASIEQLCTGLDGFRTALYKN